jgi:Domain of unknown function (DUF397)
MEQLDNWRKSTASANGSDCVQVASGDSIAVRDTRDRDGFALTVPAGTWTAFLKTLR